MYTAYANLTPNPVGDIARAKYPKSTPLLWNTVYFWKIRDAITTIQI